MDSETEALRKRLTLRSSRSYNDDVPAEWSPVDRIETANSNLKFLLFEMQSGSLSVEDALNVIIGPLNTKRLREYIDCIEINSKILRDRQRLCSVCKAPPGIGCTSSCDDHSIDDADVTPHAMAFRGTDETGT